MNGNVGSSGASQLSHSGWDRAGSSAASLPAFPVSVGPCHRAPQPVRSLQGWGIFFSAQGHLDIYDVRRGPHKVVNKLPAPDVLTVEFHLRLPWRGGPSDLLTCPTPGQASCPLEAWFVSGWKHALVSHVMFSDLSRLAHGVQFCAQVQGPVLLPVYIRSRRDQGSQRLHHRNICPCFPVCAFAVLSWSSVEVLTHTGPSPSPYPWALGAQCLQTHHGPG